MTDLATSPLDGDSILAGLGGAARALVDSLVVVAETGSTQDQASAVPTPEHGCAIFFAERQTAGVGRHGRRWASPAAANLYLSLACRFAREPRALGGLSLVVGIAVAEALRAQGFASVGLKWPNDLVADGRKLGGILVQLRARGNGGVDAIIGIGLNVRMPADAGAQIDQPWCDLAQLAAGDGLADPSRNAIASALLDRLLPQLRQFDHDGLADFLPRWRVLDALAGRAVRIHDGPRVHEGIAGDISDSGALRLRIGGQDVEFNSGEVSLRPA